MHSWNVLPQLFLQYLPSHMFILLLVMSLCHNVPHPSNSAHGQIVQAFLPPQLFVKNLGGFKAETPFSSYGKVFKVQPHQS